MGQKSALRPGSGQGIRNQKSGNNISLTGPSLGSWILDLGPVFLVLMLAITGCSSGSDIATLTEKAKSGNARAGRKLVNALGIADREASLQAYRALLDIGDGSVPWLEDGLLSDNAAVVEASAAALGSMGSKSSVPALIRALERSGKRPYAAALALGEIGAVDAAGPLVKALASSNGELRKGATRALVKIGPEVAASVLPLLSGTGGDVSQRAAIRVVGELRAEEAVGSLISTTGPNRDAAAWALGRIGDPGGLEALLGALSDNRWHVRREAAQALGSLEDPGAVPALTKALDDPETVIREWAARSLEVITGQRVLYANEEGELVPPYNLYR
jgi:HEAT repeat protein